MVYGLGTELVGTVAVVDAEAACELYGLDALPFPLGRTRPVGSMWLATRRIAPVEDRLADGDLREVRPWIEALVRADVRLACRVSYREPDSLDLRLHATLAAEHGFMAVQRRVADGVDVVDIYRTSPDYLGHAVTDALGLIRAGSRWRIRVADSDECLLESSAELDDGYDEFGFPIPRAEPDDASDLVSEGDVEAAGTINTGTATLRWVHVGGDGAYLFESHDLDIAEPLHPETLAELIDGLIARELAVHWEHRSQY